MASRTDKKQERKQAFQNSKFGRFLDSCFYKEIAVDLSENQDGSNVKTIRKPRITKTVLILLAVALVIGVSFVPFNYETRLRLNWKAFGENFADMFNPSPYRTKDWAGWWKFAWESFAFGIETPLINSAPFLQIFFLNFIATALGAVLAIPVY